MLLSRKVFLLFLSMVLSAVLTSCGGGGGGGATSTGQTIKWQLDGNGAVQFLTSDPQWAGYLFWNTYSQTNESQMTTVTATAAKVTGSSTYGYGIVFCCQDNNNFYQLLINASGRYSVFARVGGTYTPIIAWTESQQAALNGGVGVSNDISVTQQAPHQFTISFNGTQVAQFSDPNFVGGRAGFCAAIATGNDGFPATPEDIRFKMWSPTEYPNASEMTSPGTVALGYKPLVVKFSKALGKAVVISGEPDALHIVDPKTAADIAVVLPSAVKSLSLSPDGSLAAVLHEGMVSLVDLSLGALLNTSPAVGSPTEVFINNKGQIYLVGQTTGYTNLPGVQELDGRTGATVQPISTIGEMNDTVKGIYSDLSNKFFLYTLHFTPDQIYALDLDPSSGNIVASSRTPYWGDYSISDPFWLSADQALLFTAAGTYFKTSDLTYVGALGVVVSSMSHSNTVREAVVFQSSNSYLDNGYAPPSAIYPAAFKRYTGATLNPASDVQLPTIGGLQSYGIYIFHAADDSRVFVVQTGSSKSNDVGLNYYLLSRAQQGGT